MQPALLAQHAPDDLVAFGGAGSRTARDLLHDAARVAAALPPAQPGSQVLSVVRHDHYALACVLLAAMVRGHTIAFPPETGREAITAIAADGRTATIAHDTPSSAGLKVDALLAGERAVEPLTRTQLADARLRVHLFARGASTPRTSDGWLDHAQAAATLLGFAPGARIASTVAPGQPYNAVLGVLAPLLCGAAFARSVHTKSTGELGALAPDHVLSVPMALRSLALPARTRVLSAMTPLAPALARELEVREGVSVRDVFYRALAGVVALREPGGEFRTPDGGAFVPAADHDALCGGRDAHTLAAYLEERADVHDAALVVRPARNDAPRAFLLAYAGDAPTATLCDALAARFGEEARPAHAIRVVRVPRDSTGRATRDDLLRLFRLREDGAPLNFTLPEPVRESQEGDTARFTLHVPHDYAYYDGHFTGYPIMAGAVQLAELVLPCVRRVRPELGVLSQVTRLKFTGRIQPGETITLELASRTTSVDFTLKRGSTLCAGGTLTFGVPA